MSITWASTGHFFASAFHDILVGARVVAAHQTQIDSTATKVEEVTALAAVAFPPALEALEIERIAVFGLGIFCALVNKHGSATAAAAANPSINPSIFTQAEQLLAQYPQLVTQAAALFKV